MFSFLLQAARDTSSYFHAAYAALAVILLGYMVCLAARHGRKGKD